MASENQYDIIVVGCGILGLSTIMESVQKGYKVLAIDMYEPPSPWSAANDYNKMIRIEYPDKITAQLAIEAWNLWLKEPLYNSCYLKSGRLVMSPQDPNSARAIYERKSFEMLDSLNVRQNVVNIKSQEELVKLYPAFEGCRLPPNVNITLNYDCGTGLARKSLSVVYEAAKSKGAKFIFGDKGKAVKFGSHEVQVASGDIYKANKIIVSVGAAITGLIPLDKQIKPVGAFMTHIKLNDEEYEKYKDIPIFFSAEWGYFCPPEEESHIIKMVTTKIDAYAEAESPFDRNEIVNVPHYYTEYPHETFPKKGVQHIRSLLKMLTPDLADHPLIDSKICWTAMSSDSYFLIDKCPYYDGIYLASGDSSHAYKFLPNIGKYVIQKLEGTLSRELEQAWSWKQSPNFAGKNSSRADREHLKLNETDFIGTKL